jgi:hypothetical protein
MHGEGDGVELEGDVGGVPTSKPFKCPRLGTIPYRFENSFILGSCFDFVITLLTYFDDALYYKV